MNGRTGLLLGILIAQLLLIGLLLLVNSGSQATPEKLLVLQPDQVTAITLVAAADTDDDEVMPPLELRRSEDGWRVGDHPADGDKVEALLTQLTALGPGWPVATTGAARERFAVTEAGYRKKLTLVLADGTSETLLLGTSPGFKRLHARRPESDAIYSIALGDFDLPVQAPDWLDKALLALREPVLAATRRGVLRVERDSEESGEWRLIAPAADAGGDVQLAAAENVGRWLERFEDLRVVEELPAPAGEMAADVFEFTTPAGDRVYSLYHDVEADRYSMTRSDIEGRFEVPSYVALQLRASLESLLPSATDPEVPATAERDADTGEAAVE